MPGSNERWCIAEGIAHESFGDAAVALHLHSGTYYRMNAVAAFAWEAMRGPLEFEKIVDRLVAAFEVERTVLERDLRELLSELERLELVTRVSA